LQEKNGVVRRTLLNFLVWLGGGWLWLILLFCRSLTIWKACASILVVCLAATIIIWSTQTSPGISLMTQLFRMYVLVAKPLGNSALTVSRCVRFCLNFFIPVTEETTLWHEHHRLLHYYYFKLILACEQVGRSGRVIQNAKSVRHKPLVFGIMFQYRQGPLSIFGGFLE